MFLKLIAVLALPVVVFFGGAWVMSEMSNRENVRDRLHDAAAPEDQKPLNQRIGYDVSAVTRHWGALDDAGRDAMRRFLELDLVFPFLYGAALLTSMLVVWTTIGRPFQPIWLIAPVIITLVADWTENIVQWGQLRRFVDGGEFALQAGWIQMASMATVIKLVFFLGSSLFLSVLVIVMVLSALKQT